MEGVFDIGMLPKQVREMDAALMGLELPKRPWKNAVLIGMGGSALGAHVIQSLATKSLAVPFEWRNASLIPGYADRDTLVMLSSYSGTTEEVIAGYREAKKRGTGMVVLTTGGALAKLAERDGVPRVIFGTRSNPGNQPRNGVVYSMVGVLGILERAGLMAHRMPSHHGDMAHALTRAAKRFRDGKQANALVRHLAGRVIGLAASAHLEGNLHIFQNQLHESAKHFAFFDTISELNHHLMEGLEHPNHFAKKLAMVLFKSSMYPALLAKRYPLTAEVFKRQGASVLTVELKGRNCLEDVAELLVLGTQTAALLATRHHENPNLIPWVDFFKKRLGGG